MFRPIFNATLNVEKSIKKALFSKHPSVSFISTKAKYRTTDSEVNLGVPCKFG